MTGPVGPSRSRPAAGSVTWVPVLLCLLGLVMAACDAGSTRVANETGRPASTSRGPVSSSPLSSSSQSPDTVDPDGRAVSGRDQVSALDPVISHDDCTLLGRAWARGGSASGDPGPGCRRRTCLDPADHAKLDPDQETCVVGGRRGLAYGQPIDVRRCTALHRRWIGEVNYCASEPHRRGPMIPDAPQCPQKPWTTYVELRAAGETEGLYDECLSPAQVSRVASAARRGGRSFAAQAAVGSRVQCGYRPRGVYVDGRCRERRGPVPAADRGGVLLVGDSVSWMGTNELARLHPEWVIDAIPGRSVEELPGRLGRFVRTHGRPDGLIVALGTNPAPGWDKSDYRTVLHRTVPGAKVMFVTPYRRRGTSTPGIVTATERYATQMREIAAGHRVVCLADWRGLVTRHPKLLIDGVHETKAGESVWAAYVARAWARCTR